MTGYDVELVGAEPRPTVVVAAATGWREYPSLWPVLLGEVWECVRAAGITGGCRNVMLYRDRGTGVDVEVGVELAGDVPLTGRVVASRLPAGPAAMTTHRGSYAGLGQAHEAVGAWCREHGHRPVGTRWEVYGPHREDPAEVWTEVYWLLSDAPTG